ncbi:MAG: trypsin-like peptidase domain-containing protein [Gemmataceae bacterium]|nr:trypsin-like peptidase domain-containing protein [Gemmataceae bacterium]MDW8264009.1 trypsin-like peptidase domain-containing protein [Gemmataceae bacterium]
MLARRADRRNGNPTGCAPRAAESLKKLGRPALSEVLKLIELAARDKDLDVRIRAVQTLGAFGQDAAQAVPSLAAIMDEKLPDSPRLPAQTLGDKQKLEARLLKSTVWVAWNSPEGYLVRTSSGFLIDDRDRKLVVTVGDQWSFYSPTRSDSGARVFFRASDASGQVLTRALDYVSPINVRYLLKQRLCVHASVVARDDKSGLVLLQLQGPLHGDCMCLRLSSQKLELGQTVHSFGPTGSEGRSLSEGALLWQYVSGKVVGLKRAKVHENARESGSVQITFDQHLSSEGSPIVNDNGELVAVLVNRSSRFRPTDEDGNAPFGHRFR